MSNFGASSIPKDILIKVIGLLRRELDLQDTTIPHTKGDLDALAMQLKRQLPKALNYTWTDLTIRALSKGRIHASIDNAANYDPPTWPNRS